VIAATPTTTGGLVVPMFGPGGCIGVVALEIRHGREQEATVQAVAAMVAAQLAAAVAAWPAGSGDPTAKAPKARTA
jgi:GAF domain-containing protein